MPPNCLCSASGRAQSRGIAVCRRKAEETIGALPLSYSTLTWTGVSTSSPGSLRKDRQSFAGTPLGRERSNVGQTGFEPVVVELVTLSSLDESSNPAGTGNGRCSTIELLPLETERCAYPGLASRPRSVIFSYRSHRMFVTPTRRQRPLVSGAHGNHLLWSAIAFLLYYTVSTRFDFNGALLGYFDTSNLLLRGLWVLAYARPAGMHESTPMTTNITGATQGRGWLCRLFERSKLRKYRRHPPPRAALSGKPIISQSRCLAM